MPVRPRRGAMSQVEQRLEALGLSIPAPPKPAANYVPWTLAGDTVYVAGQVPMVDGKVQVTGKVGSDHDLEAAQAVARTCALNVLAVLKDAAGSVGRTLDDLRVVRMSGFVNTAPGFTDVHLVTNGASDLIAQVFGERGVHARSAVGMAELPLDVPFELEAIAVFV
jgi:enamine deaminase RidA (YjgF/YER057c/UK114 family)